MNADEQKMFESLWTNHLYTEIENILHKADSKDYSKISKENYLSLYS